MKDDNIYIENCQNNRFEIPVTTVEKEGTYKDWKWVDVVKERLCCI